MDAMRVWIGLATHPSVLRRALATAAVVGVILTLINHGGEVLGGRLRPDHVWPIAFTFLVPFAVATVSSIAVTRRPGAGREEVIPSGEVEEVGTFPNSNPNPVFRIGSSGVLLYANPASAALMRGLQESVGGRLPAELVTKLRAAADGEVSGTVQVEAAGRTYRLKAVAVGDAGFINVYGSEVTGSDAMPTPAA